MELQGLIEAVYEQSPIIAILGVIAYKLRQDLTAYAKMCHEENVRVMEKLFELLNKDH